MFFYNNKNKSFFFIYFPLITIIIAIIVYLIYYNRTYENYENLDEVSCLSKEETQRFIKEDLDGYIKNLSIYDLRARKAKSNDEYKQKVIDSCLDITAEQKKKLGICAKEARKFFDNNHQWIFACIDNNYEEGFPHTRSTVIFLSPNIINSNDENLTKTLIHESIHIYQRYNKEAMEIYLKKNNYTISRKKPVGSLIRANPDLDEFIYKDEQGRELVAYYSSENPKGINDITLTNYHYEHPFEKMAYEIAENYSKQLLSRYKDI